MVKIITPLLSAKASGLIGPRLVFSLRKSGQQVRIQKSQKDAKTSSQLDHRDRYQLYSQMWYGIKDYVDDKKAWEFYGKIFNISGTAYNAFMSAYLKNLYKSDYQAFFRNLKFFDVYLNENPNPEETRYLLTFSASTEYYSPHIGAAFLICIGEKPFCTLWSTFGLVTETENWTYAEAQWVNIPWNYKHFYIWFEPWLNPVCNVHLPPYLVKDIPIM